MDFPSQKVESLGVLCDIRFRMKATCFLCPFFFSLSSREWGWRWRAVVARGGVEGLFSYTKAILKMISPQHSSNNGHN